MLPLIRDRTVFHFDPISITKSTAAIAEKGIQAPLWTSSESGGILFSPLALEIVGRRLMDVDLDTYLIGVVPATATSAEK